MAALPKVVSLLFLWGAVAAVVVFIDPILLRDAILPGVYLPFFLLVTLCAWYSLALLTHSAIKSLLFTVTIVAGLVLSTLKLMHWGLAVSLGLTLVIESWYIYGRHEKIKPSDEQKDRGTGI